MENRLNLVLSISAILLGLYILLVPLLQSNKVKQEVQIPIVQTPLPSQKIPEYQYRYKTENYHIGCYREEYQADHFSQIRRKIMEIQNQQKNQNIDIAASKTLMNTNPNFEKNSLQVAKQFEQYIKKITQIKKKNVDNSDSYQGLKKSYLQYTQCYKQYGHIISKQECLQNWNEFQVCSNKLDQIRKKLEYQFHERDIINKEINNILGSFNIDTKKQIVKNKYLQDLLRIYEKQMRQIEEKIITFNNKIEQIKQSNVTQRYRLSEIMIKLSNAKKALSQCAESRLKFKNCQEINLEIQNFGYGSINVINEKIRNKRITLTKLMNMIEKSKYHDGTQSLKKMLLKGNQQLRILIKINVQTQTEITKHCGCSLNRQQSLKKQILQIQTLLYQIKKSIQSVQEKIKNIYSDIEIYSKLKIKKTQEYQLKVSQYNIPTNPSSDIQVQSINQHKIRLFSINQKILNFQRDLNSLEFQCNQLKQSLQRRVSNLDGVLDCLRKKQYYLKLMKQVKNDKIVTNYSNKQSQKIKLAIKDQLKYLDEL